MRLRCDSGADSITFTCSDMTKIITRKMASAVPLTDTHVIIF